MDRKAATRAYKEQPRPAGLFSVTNTADGTVLIGTTANLPGMLNRQRFQLEMGSHPDKALQADWNRLGPEAFTFEILDELAPAEDAGTDPNDELAVLMEMWLSKLAQSGRELYPTSRRGVA